MSVVVTIFDLKGYQWIVNRKKNTGKSTFESSRTLIILRGNIAHLKN